MNQSEIESVNNFREYLKIPSVQPNAKYDGCLNFLEKQSKSLDLPFRVHYCVPHKPIIIITWIGQKPELPSILMNSHMDVVAVFEEKWTYKPFGAHVDEKGNIYARGAQDMKCVGIQYLEAIRRLKKDGIKLKRTLHVSFMPDEEIGGVDGMQAFVKTTEFSKLNVGFAFDEGMATPNDDYILFYGERSRWSLKIHCPGHPGHGSLLLDNTAGEKVRYILNKFYEFREQEKLKLDNNPSLTLGDVTTINLTILEGGVQSNVIPSEFTILIDCRNAPTVDLGKWEQTIEKWCKEAGDGVWAEYEIKNPHVPPTKLDDSNLYWKKFIETASKINVNLKPEICCASGDMRFLREVGIPTVGFSPMNHTENRMHGNDEYLNTNVFVKGIGIYCNLITAVANL